jgi:hypothetical protein
VSQITLAKKRCTRCGIRKLLVRFRMIGVSRTGEARIHPWCRTCESEVAGIRQIERRQRERQFTAKEPS